LLEPSEDQKDKAFKLLQPRPNALPPRSPEFKKRNNKIVGGQIDKKVELLAPVLDQARKQRYRALLVSKSMLPMFGIKLFDVPGK
jgi:hypothetical protein